MRGRRTGEEEERGPERTCVATRQAGPVERMIRFVPDPAGRLVPDIRGRLPGRGAWVTATRAAVAEAVRRQAFARSLKRPVAVSADLPALVEELLRADARQSLALANKAGGVVAGFGKVETAVDRGHVMALVVAAEAGDDGRRKLTQAVRRRHGSADAIPVIDLLGGDELDLALGRENAIYAALLAGSAGEAFMRRARRLATFQHGFSPEKGPDAGSTPASTGPSPLGTAAGPAAEEA